MKITDRYPATSKIAPNNFHSGFGVSSVQGDDGTKKHIYLQNQVAG